MSYEPLVWRRVSFASYSFAIQLYQKNETLGPLFLTMSLSGYVAKAVDLKDPVDSSEDIGDSQAETPLPATLVRIPAESQEKTSE